MFRLLTSAAALALLTGAAFAADLPVYEAAPQPAPFVEPAYNWTGFYLGAHGGYSFGEADIDGVGDIDDFDGGLVGGQLGFNYQWNWLVLGVEGDGSYLMAEADEDFGVVGAGGIGIDLEANWAASVRGRLGLAFNRFMIYGTGGAAWVDIDADADFGGGAGDSDSETLDGWVYGGGAEMMVTQNVTVGVEYLHYDFDEETFDIGGGADADGEADVIRGRVNIKFNSLFGG